MTTIRSVSFWVFCFLAGLCNATAQDRSLHWDSLIVEARLDGEGMLHVTERHAMVFDGAWNGGERSFQLRSWQRLDLHGLTEIDSATQARTPWVEGDLDAVGHYAQSGNVLRWRARMPSDPPFERTTKIYEIAYSLSGVLIPEDGTYRLEHDLAFPNRSGEIRVFDATLAIDPIWQTTGLPSRWHRENLQPGESVFVNASLRHSGANGPREAAAASALPSTTSASWLRHLLVLALTAFAVAHAIALYRRERARGRFEPAPPSEGIDEAWLQANVFDRPPEVVGAAWDLDTSASEVAALLARLEQDGALRSRVETRNLGWFKRNTLHMELLCDRDSLASHERKLIDALFFGDSRATDTQRIRERYSKSGFTPAALIKSGIERQLPLVFANKLSVPAWARWLTALLGIAAIACLVVSAVQAPDAAHFVIVTSIVLFVVSVFGLVFGYLYRKNVLGLGRRLLRALICVGALCGVIAFVLLGGVVPLVPLGVVALSLCAATFVNMIFNTMRTRETPEALAMRRRLGVARLYFERELRSATPRLADEWFPYLLAFGLGPKIDRWFEAFGRERGSAVAGSGATTPMGASRSTGGSTWTGGGGTFGGAGASGTWAAAVGSIASGVAQPSSSGGSSGGGSSMSSGGGGGGGW